MTESTFHTSIHTGIIRTITGKNFNLFEPEPDMIDIIDIAHGLANKGHFSGFTPRYFSIAEHSIMVCDEYSFWNNEQPDSVKLLALLHDAAEAYIGDMVKPLKIHMPGFVEVENRIMEAICKKFGMDIAKMPLIKASDLLIQDIEYQAFFMGGLIPQSQVSYLDPERARIVFIDRFNELYHEN